MLNIRYGSDWRANSDALQQKLLKKAAAGQSGQILIVPEQFSFDSEWRLCEKGGARVSAFAEVLSFTRLATRVFAAVGGAAVQTLDNSGRLIAMAAALEQARSRLKIYGRHILKPEFLLQLLQLVDECKGCGVQSEDLRALSGELNGTLAQKTEELSLILESYAAVCAHTDPTDRLTLLGTRLRESGWAAGRSFYLDGFLDFTAQELAVVEELLKQADSVTVNLCCDGLLRGLSVFDLTRRTAAELQRLAARHNIPAEAEQIAAAARTAPLAQLQKELFRASPEPFAGDSSAVTLHTAADVQAECRGAVAALQRLLQKGCRCRDIAVVYTSAAVYQPELMNLLDRCGIAGYFAGAKDLLSEPLCRMVLSALEAASYGMEGDTVAEYLKSGYAPLTEEQCDALTAYAFLWGLQGSAWDRSFTANPGGLRARAEQPELLDKINQAREQAIVPLLTLKSGLAGAKNTGEQVLALHRFFKDISLRERLQEKVDELTGDGQLQRAQEVAQLYKLLTRTLEQIYSVLKDTVRSSEEFTRFLRAAYSRQSVGSIPAALDCVHLGTPAAMRQYRERQLLFLGASEGLLPAATQGGSLLSEAERRQLQKMGLQLAPDAGEQLERELLNAYLTLTSADESLFVSCAADAPSYLFLKLQTLFPDSTAPLARLLPATPELAAQEAAMLPQAQREELLEKLPALQEPTAELLSRAAYQPGELQSETVQALYGKTLRLTASRIDKYAACPFAFFLNYGLKAAELKPATLDAPVFGDMVHYVLEKTAKQVLEEGGFAAITLERTLELADKYREEFTELRLAALKDKTSRERYLYERNASEVQDIVQELWEELRQSLFIPAGFELGFGGADGELPPVSVHGKKASCELTGYVDRADIFRQGDRTYVRVVDYKTGKKSFDYADILHGSGLQMLIYLFALEKGGLDGQKPLPAGVLYFPARLLPLSSTAKPGDAEAEKNRRRELRRKGLLLNDPTVLEAMEPCEEPLYLPCKRNKDGELVGELASVEELRQLERFVYGTLARQTDEIFSGNIAPTTHTRGDKNGLCDYCEYGKVCHFASGSVPAEPLETVSNRGFFEELTRREQDNG